MRSIMISLKNPSLGLFDIKFDAIGAFASGLCMIHPWHLGSAGRVPGSAAASVPTRSDTLRVSDGASSSSLRSVVE